MDRHPDLERFMDYVKKTDTCWLWTAGFDCKRRYGRFWSEGKMRQAHRFSYLVHVGPLDPTLTIDHICRVTACVNPSHLRQITAVENARIGQLLDEPRCGHGDWHYNTNGHKECRPCHREAVRRHREKANV